MTTTKKSAPRNKTLTLSEKEKLSLKERLLTIENLKNGESAINKTINADTIKALKYLPNGFADLIIIDPPYNLTKDFNGHIFKKMSDKEYDAYLKTWFPAVCEKLKPNGSLYMCGDWKCSSALERAMKKQLTVLNRITWQREKGRGALTNWKNGMEDIWFGVKNPNDYYFDVKSVMMRRKVYAPYKESGVPKDWEETQDGNFRDTCPSNFWDDISIPFWSMSENTPHPTQKPEKLYAKLILASSKKGDIVFDPFLGSGTASVVAKKLGRKYVGIELNEEYALMAEKRLKDASKDKTIQGYNDGVFWERNTSIMQKKK